MYFSFYLDCLAADRRQNRKGDKMSEMFNVIRGRSALSAQHFTVSLFGEGTDQRFGRGVPPCFTAGFEPLARVTLHLADGKCFQYDLPGAARLTMPLRFM